MSDLPALISASFFFTQSKVICKFNYEKLEIIWEAAVSMKQKIT